MGGMERGRKKGDDRGGSHIRNIERRRKGIVKVNEERAWKNGFQ